MSRYRTFFVLHLSRDEAQVVCACAIDELGWVVTDETDARVTCQERAHAVSPPVNPARLAISFSADPAGPTEVTVNGANFGSGPVQWGHVRQQVESLVRSIEARATGFLRERRRAKAIDTRNVVVNRTRLADALVASLEHELGTPVPDGLYWYDRVSGAWGSQGGPTICLIRPGLVLGGPLRADASGGATGLFVNGRELDDHDAAQLRRLTDLSSGRYWIDAQGNFGAEGGPRMGNLLSLARNRPIVSGGARRSTRRSRSSGRERIRFRRPGMATVPTG